MATVWKDRPDAPHAREWNRKKAIVAGHRVEIYSNQDASAWYYRVDGEECVNAYDDEAEVMFEAVCEAKETNNAM